MAIAVSYGGDDEFRAFVYGQNKDPRTLNYLENQLSNISQTLTSAGMNFFADARSIYDRFNGSEAMRLARAAINKAGSVFQTNIIRAIWESSEFQNAPLCMQRYIIAEPSVRKLFNEQRIDGYSDTYVDMHPGTIGESHYDYRQVMNGIVTIDEDGLELTRFFPDELLEGDRELDLSEKADILNSWKHVASLMKFGDRDATSVWNNKL